VTLLRIGVLLEYPTVLGGERSWLTVARGLRTRGAATFELLVPPNSEVSAVCQSEGWTVHHWNPRETTDAQLLERLQGWNVSLIHANSLAMSRRLGRLAPSLNAACTGHVRDLCRLNATAVQQLHQLQSVIAVSHATRDNLLAQGLRANHCQTIYNGIDVAERATDEQRQAVRLELGDPAETRVVIAVGQISLRKAPDVLAAAAGLIVQQWPGSLPGVRFVHLGERWSTKAETVELEQQMTQQLRENGAASRFRRLGWRSDARRWIAAADVLVHPARQEPLGRVLLEALAEQTPVVATAVGGTREIIDDDVHGRLVPPDSPTAIAEAVLQILREPDRAARYRRLGLQRVHQRFSAESAAVGHLQFWTEAALRGRREPGASFGDGSGAEAGS
jgi:glycosyltransferase involved in cell wall biosynthesis